MNTPKFIRFAALMLLACVMSVPVAFAQTPEYSTISFDQPTSVGDKVLEPGQYLIRVLPSRADRNRVQITNLDKSTIYATLLTVPHAFGPDEEKPNTELVFYPAYENQPRTLRTWFAPNPITNEGHDIVYDEARAQLLARASNAPVVTYRGPAVVTEETTPDLAIVTPEAKYEPYVAPRVTTVETVQTEAPVQMASNELPRTAGKLPLVMLFGLLSLAGAVALRSFNR
jgi:hypothetical protein